MINEDSREPSQIQTLAEGSDVANPITECGSGQSLEVARRKTTEEITIENMVASGTVADKFDLPWLASKLARAGYTKKRFPGLVYRVENPRGAFLLFSTGKAVATGFRTIGDMNTGVERLVAQLKRLDIRVVSEPKFVVSNVVAIADLKMKFQELDALAINLGLENVEYEPEVFPGLVYRLPELKMVLLVFNSGKVLITGGKNTQDCARAVEILRQRFRSIGAL